MRFFSKMKVRGKCVLEHVDNEITKENQRWRRLRQSQALGKHFQEHCAEHETRAQCNKVSQRLVGPLVRGHNDSPNDVRKCSRKSEQYRLSESAHKNK